MAAKQAWLKLNDWAKAKPLSVWRWLTSVQTVLIVALLLLWNLLLSPTQVYPVWVELVFLIAPLATVFVMLQGRFSFFKAAIMTLLMHLAIATLLLFDEQQKYFAVFWLIMTVNAIAAAYFYHQHALRDQSKKASKKGQPYG